MDDDCLGPECSRIHFDEVYKTFRLYCGNSLYAFAISAELSLEHIYWGKVLQGGYDLRYLSRSGRNMHFNTQEKRITNRFLCDNLPHQMMQAETLDELQEIWRQNRAAGRNRSISDPDTIHKIRMKNISERLMSMASSSNVAGLEALAIDEITVTSPPKLPPRSPSRLPRAESFNSPGKSSRPVSRAASPTRLPRSFERPSGDTGKGSICLEYSDHGTGDFRTPSFLINTASASSISPLRYKRHSIMSGKPPLPDALPGMRCSEDDASTLIITMIDVFSGLEVNLYYTCLHNYDAVIRRAEFRNISMNPADNIVVSKASSLTADYESDVGSFHLLQLSGSWGRERSVVETKLTHGVQTFGSTRGVSSHQHNPFAVITTGPASESTGEVKAFTLLYSGNFLFEAEVNEFNRLRINFGINPLGFSWHIKPGGTFATPEALMVRSDEGLGGMSRMQHRIISDLLLPRTWADANPPVLINTWEAMYFNVNHDSVIQLASTAAKVGCDLICIDDGWFGNRNNIASSLGDWELNPLKFPQGLAALADELGAMGVQLGIWLEPEMVSEESELFQRHPEWCLHVPGRPLQVGRNQLVLDITREDVRDHIFNTLSAVLSSAKVVYLKWDMNRPLTEVFSLRANARQFETSHRFVLGLYDLQKRVTEAFPHILLENCASGGGRFDAGMLYFSPQIWCSDNTDALVRLRIQYGTSIAYPVRTIGALVSSIPNHITGNSTRARTRSFVAMCGTMGFTLDFGGIQGVELMQFKEHTSVYRQLAPLIRDGDLYRLWSPFKVPYAAWMHVSRDKTEAAVFAFSFNSECWSNIVPRLMLKGLLPATIYEITEPLPNNVEQQVENLRIIETIGPVYQLGYSSVCFTGDILMNAGLPVRFYTLDDSIMFKLKAVGQCKARLF